MGKARLTVFGLSSMEMEAIQLSLRVALWGVAWSLPLAVSVAWLLARGRFPGKILLDGLVHLPLVLPPVAVGYVLLVMFGRHGAIGAWLFEEFHIEIAFTWRGAAIAAAIMAFPLMVRAVRLSLETVDRKLESAARPLGAGPADVFLSITLPLIVPGIITGVILAFARSLGEFGATITFVSNIPGQTRTLPLAIYTLIQAPGGEETAMRLVLISVAVALVALALSELLARRAAARLEA